MQYRPAAEVPHHGSWREPQRPAVANHAPTESNVVSAAAVGVGKTADGIEKLTPNRQVTTGDVITGFIVKHYKPWISWSLVYAI